MQDDDIEDVDLGDADPFRKKAPEPEPEPEPELEEDAADAEDAEEVQAEDVAPEPTPEQLAAEQAALEERLRAEHEEAARQRAEFEAGIKLQAQAAAASRRRNDAAIAPEAKPLYDGYGSPTVNTGSPMVPALVGTPSGGMTGGPYNELADTARGDKLQMAKLLHAIGKYDEALGVMDEIRSGRDNASDPKHDIGPSNSVQEYRLAMHLHVQGKFEEAVSICSPRRLGSPCTPRC